ncbi:MAG: hypothetical protein P794_02490 [Epsilonproteobacteria bacterium (ex Lamellibrachia satsuma)]|nr:MAG: hypothetical protein P794_02490 [Epsilonproteobacteria bacterium (ex Lamellibrachia satsuma)]
MGKTVRLILILMTFSAISAFAEHSKYAASAYKYVSVYNKGDLAQQMDSAMNLKHFRKIIKQRWKQGYDISEIKYGNGKWIGVFSKSSKKTHQTYIVARRWTAVDNILKEYWDQGYYITNIEHGLAEWIVVFEKNTSYTDQAYERRKKLDDFVDHVNRRWKEGFNLIDLEYGEGRWTGIFAAHTGYKGQALMIRSRWKDMTRQIKSYWEKGYRIANLEYTLGKWMCLFTKTVKNAQGYEASPTAEALKKVFIQQQKKGFGLIDLAEGW